MYVFLCHWYHGADASGISVMCTCNAIGIMVLMPVASHDQKSHVSLYILGVAHWQGAIVCRTITEVKQL